LNDPSGIQGLNDLRQFLVETTPSVPVWQFLPGLLATAALCYLLGLFYRNYGHSLSNRASFARNFVVIGTTTMLIITIVKSSLALSLGLVGALSIVRFRTAVKEPEELGYLFMTIAIGLGFGAGQWLVTLVAFVFITSFLFLRHRADGKPEDGGNLYLTVRRPGTGTTSLTAITAALREQCAALDLRRFDERDSGLEVSYRVSFDSFEQLDQAKAALHAFDPAIRVSFVDNDDLL
jgi:uncharacterized membrane protein YhiD involved in acid resistance